MSMSQATNVKQHKAEDRATQKWRLLGLARFWDVQVEVDKVGVLQCSVPDGPDNSSSRVGHRLVVNCTTVHHVIPLPLLKREQQVAISRITSNRTFYRVCGVERVFGVYFLIINKPRHKNFLREEVFHIASQGRHIFSSMLHWRQHKHWWTLRVSSCKCERNFRPCAAGQIKYTSVYLWPHKDI